MFDYDTKTYKKMCNKIFGFLADIIPSRRVKLILAVTDTLEKSHLVTIVERWIATEQNVNNNTQGPHIHLNTIFMILKDFWSYIPG
jgi:hypothetical protein